MLLTVLLAAWHFWTREIVDTHGLDLDFQFDPKERFELDSKNSWIVTVVVILVASGLIAF